jgi:hypothetical protein
MFYDGGRAGTVPINFDIFILFVCLMLPQKMSYENQRDINFRSAFSWKSLGNCTKETTATCKI